MVQRRLKEKLTGMKFLLVLDDNRNENQFKWEQVQKALGFGAQGSRLLVTARGASPYTSNNLSCIPKRKFISMFTHGKN